MTGTATLQLQFHRKCERIFILVILFARLLLCPGSRPLVLTRRGYFLTIPLYHASEAKEETDCTACSGELTLPARGKRSDEPLLKFPYILSLAVIIYISMLSGQRVI